MDQIKIGKFIADCRKKEKLTQAKLAEKLGITDRAISKWETGKAMVFPVVMYGCESWTSKKAERRRIDAFELWCWRRLLRVPWTARRSNQSILKEIRPGLFIGRTDAEAEAPIFCSPDAKS